MKFRLIKSDKSARLGELHFDKGIIHTPAFMPVGTNGTVKGMTVEDLESTNSEIILGFVISARDPEFVPSMEDWSPVPSMSDGAPDYSSLPDVGEMVEAGEPWQGISAPKGGIVNLTVLQEIDAKKQMVTLRGSARESRL